MKLNLMNYTVGEKLDRLTRRAKRKTAHMIDGVRAAWSRMANGLSKRLHKTGGKVTKVGTKILDAGEKVQEMA